MDRKKLKEAIAAAGLASFVVEVQEGGGVALSDATPPEARERVAALVLEEKARRPARAERLAQILTGRSVEARAAFELAVLVGAEDLPGDAREILESWAEELLNAWHGEETGEKRG